MKDLAFFTVVNNAYLPKARVLAKSAREHHPRARFSLILADQMLPSEEAKLRREFDEVILLEELPLEIENRKAWLFQHSIVELCTAIKAQAALTLLERTPGEKLIYLDPDILVVSRLRELEKALDRHEIVLTPHQLDADEVPEAIHDNEVGCLRNGVFNLGFLGLRKGADAERLLQWWNKRLMRYCFDHPRKGLFTDQKWFDLVPVFFKSCHVLRDCGYNVATWNLAQRRVRADDSGVLRVNGRPLRFFHFSGFDSGAQKLMLKKYGLGSPELFALRRRYVEELRRAGQERLGRAPWAYGVFERGTKITTLQRIAFRESQRLQRLFPDPFRQEASGCDLESWFGACDEVIDGLAREGHLANGLWERPSSTGQGAEGKWTRKLNASIVGRHEN